MREGNKKLLLIGGGGHCKSVVDSLYPIIDYNEIGIIDNNYSLGVLDEKKYVFDIPIIGTDNDLEKLYGYGYTHAFITIGSVGDVTIRKKLYEKIIKIGFSIPNVIDKSSVVASNINLGVGIYIGKKAIVNADVIVGNCVILNTGSIVEHDCSIGDFVHLATGSTLCGNVSIGSDTHIGAGSIVKQGIQIGCSTMVGMGSIVTHNLGSFVKAYGVPCKEVLA